MHLSAVALLTYMQRVLLGPLCCQQNLYSKKCGVLPSLLLTQVVTLWLVHLMDFQRNTGHLSSRGTQRRASK